MIDKVDWSVILNVEISTKFHCKIIQMKDIVQPFSIFCSWIQYFCSSLHLGFSVFWDLHVFKSPSKSNLLQPNYDCSTTRDIWVQSSSSGGSSSQLVRGPGARHCCSAHHSAALITLHAGCKFYGTGGVGGSSDRDGSVLLQRYIYSPSKPDWLRRDNRGAEPPDWRPRAGQWSADSSGHHGIPFNSSCWRPLTIFFFTVIRT